MYIFDQFTLKDIQTIAYLTCIYMHSHVIQWNPSKKDTIGTAQSVLIIEVSSCQR